MARWQIYGVFVHRSMASTKSMRTPLNREQQRIVAQIARSRLEPCYFCRSRKWLPPAGAEPSTGTWVLVLRCAECGNGTDVMYLSREEAFHRLNLRHGPFPRRNEMGGFGR